MINTTDSKNPTNIACIRGEIIDGLKLNHKTYGESFYTFEVGKIGRASCRERVYREV